MFNSRCIAGWCMALIFGISAITLPQTSISGSAPGGITYAALDTSVSDTVQADTIDTIPEPADTLPEQQETPPEDPPEDVETMEELAPLDQPGEQDAEDAPVEYEAQDSVVFEFYPERIVYLYGNAEVRHPKGNLEAGMITLNLSQNLMEALAESPEDTLSHPVLTRDGESIRSERILYNYATDKGKFNAARVTIDRGNIQGQRVKRTAPEVVFVEDGQYSTCELEHPHFYIQASQMKVFEEDEVFFTNAQLYLLDIPYPIVFPFGYIPSRLEEAQSGLLEPTYVFQGQERRGLGMQNVGWFQHINEYMTGQISFDLFTSGSFFADGRLNYRRTDAYNGNVQIGYSRDRGLEPTDSDFTVNVQRRLQLSHSQDVNPFSRISANIDLRTQDYYAQNSYNIGDRASTTTNSNLSYNYNHPENLYSFRVSTRLNQDFTQNRTTLSGPDISFSTQSMTPFERSGPQADESWFETLTLRYESSFRNRFRFTPVDDTDINFFDALLDRSLYEEATDDDRYIDYGLEQSVRGNMQLLTNEFVNLSANFNYNEYWLPQTTRQFFDEEAGQIQSEIEPGFATARDFDIGSSLNTTIYGISNARIGNLEGFRHTLRPSLSYTYNPDFSEPFWGVYEEVEGDPDGRTYSRFQDSPVGGPSAGERQSISFSLSNRLETRHVTRDSTGEQSSDVMSLIDELSASLSYNFAADEFHFSNLTTRFRTSIFDDIRLNANATFDLYAQDDENNRIDRLAFQEDQGLARLQQFRVTASTSFSGGDGGRPEFTESQAYFPPEYDPLDQGRFDGYDQAFNREPVQRLHAPWSFSMSFNYQWNRQISGDITQRATLNIDNISLQLTPEWQVGTQIGYDFIDEGLTPSRFRVSRTLHCWNLSFEWNPFDDFPFYMFRLTVNDSQIQSLFQKLPGLNNLERTQSDINRRY